MVNRTGSTPDASEWPALAVAVFVRVICYFWRLVGWAAGVRRLTPRGPGSGAWRKIG